MNRVLALFMILLFVSLFYSQGPWSDSWSMFWKYTDKLLILLFIIPLFSNQRYRRHLLLLIQIVVIANVLLGIAFYYLHNPANHWHGFRFANPLNAYSTQDFSCLVAAYSYLFLYQLCHKPNKAQKAINTALFILFIFYLFRINGERVGILAEIILLLAFIIQNPKYYKWFGGLIICTILIASLTGTTRLKARLHSTVYQLKIYHTNHNTDTGLRLSEATDSYHLWLQAPIFGHGVGSFKALYIQQYAQHYQQYTKPNAPENDFAHTLVELGIIGLAAQLLWFILVWRNAFKYLDRENRQYVLAFNIGFIALTLTASQFTSHFALMEYAIITSLFFGSAITDAYKLRDTAPKLLAK